MDKHNKETRFRSAQAKLAYQVVVDIHSEKDAEDSEKLTRILFGEGDISLLTESEKLSLIGSIPMTEKVSGNIIDVLVEIGASLSKREAREFIESGSILVNGTKATFETEILSYGVVLIKRGKKKFFLIKN